MKDEINMATGSRVLPVTPPPITSYANCADILSIALTMESSMNWFCKNFIQLYGYFEYTEEGNLAMFPLNFGWLRYSSVPFFAPVQEITRDYVNHHYGSFIDFAIDSVSLGYYLHFDYDRFHVPNAPEYYHTEHVSHEVLLFGVDCDAKVFHVADFFENSKFAFQTVSFADLQRGFNIESLALRNPPTVRMLRPTPVEVPLTTASIKSKLRDYTESSCLSDNWSDHLQDRREDSVYGLANYALLDHYLELTREGRTVLDVRPFHVLYDHKIAMRLRVEHMQSLGVIGLSSDQAERLLVAERVASINRNLFLKYSVDRKPESLGKISNNLRKLENIDRQILDELDRSLS